jgi:hypothetical protein
MNTIEFNDSELNEMKRFYLSQLAEAESRVNHIKGMLAKLGAPVVSAAADAKTVVVNESHAVTEIQEPAEEQETEDVRRAYVSTIPVEYTKRGRGSKRKKERKSKWGNYITTVLRSKGEPMTVNELLEHAMKRTANQEAGEASVRGGIAASLNRLAKEYHRLRTINVEGRRGRYYGLSVWFNLDGTFKPGFGNRFGKLEVHLKDAADTGDSED